VPKFGFTSVRRNKLKRQLREITRAHVLTQPASYDVLLRARREAYDAGFATLRDDLVAAAAKLRPRASAT
jgi:ribonuclease P protein component